MSYSERTRRRLGEDKGKSRKIWMLGEKEGSLFHQVSRKAFQGEEKGLEHKTAFRMKLATLDKRIPLQGLCFWESFPADCSGSRCIINPEGCKL